VTGKEDLEMERRMATVETVLKTHVESCDRKASEAQWLLRLVAGLLIAYAVKTIFHISV
jgi:hypothetical protein